MRRKEFLSLVPGVVACSAAPRPTRAPLGPTGPDDEAFWSAIAKAYDRAEFVNLENGFFTRAPRVVIEAHARHAAMINRRGAHYMRTDLAARLELARWRLAAFVEAPADELALLRNTTEAMNLVLQGFDWRPGDEIVHSNQDYDTVVGILRQLVRRRGVVLREVALPEQPETDAQVVDAYLQQVGPRTRLAIVTQVIHLTGHVLPVVALATALRDRGVQVLVDGAHALGQLPVAIDELGVDYYAASLHKWVGAPLGNGLLWIRGDHIPQIEPLFADVLREPEDIRRFEHIGTRPAADFESIADALDFHDRLGTAAKRARLLYLRQRWVRAVAEHPRIRLRSPRDDARSSAIATVAVEGLSPAEVQQSLWTRHGIYTVAIDHPVIQGVRVTVHPSTSPDEVDRLAAALRTL